MTSPRVIPLIDAAVDAVLDAVPGDIVLGIPLAIGKPNPFVNALYRRTKANPSRRRMIATALSPESGQVVSGVGGQYNFVAMGHAIPDARSILMLRATHDNKDGLHSSIVWNYGNVTIPRHLRDIVVTEYGVADLRGQADSEVVRRLIAVADSRFQPQPIKHAQAHGKLPADCRLPAHYRGNLPEALGAKLHPWSQAGLLPAFPFGTDMTADELHIVTALKRMKRITQHPVELVTMAVKSLWDGKDAPHAYLERLGLDEADSFKTMFIRRLFAGNL